MSYLFFIDYTIVPVSLQTLSTDADAIEYAERYPKVDKIVNANTGKTIWQRKPKRRRAKGAGR